MSASSTSPVISLDLSNRMERGEDSRPFLERLGFTDFTVRQASNQYSCEAPPEMTRVSHAPQGFTSYFIKGMHVFDVVWSSPNNSNRYIRPMKH